MPYFSGWQSGGGGGGGGARRVLCSVVLGLGARHWGAGFAVYGCIVGPPFFLKVADSPESLAD